MCACRLVCHCFFYMVDMYLMFSVTSRKSTSFKFVFTPYVKSHSFSILMIIILVLYVFCLLHFLRIIRPSSLQRPILSSSIILHVADVILEKMANLRYENGFEHVSYVKYSRKENSGFTGRIFKKDRSRGRRISFNINKFEMLLNL